MRPIGVLYPGHSAEDDYVELSPARRLPFAVRHTVMAEDAHRLDALLDWGRPTGSPTGQADPARAPPRRWCGPARAAASRSAGTARTSRRRRLAAAAGVPASSTSLAFVAAARALGVSRGRGRRHLS